MNQNNQNFRENESKYSTLFDSFRFFNSDSESRVPVSVLFRNFPVGEFLSGGIPRQMKSGEEIPLRDGASQEKLPHKNNPKMMKIQWNTA